MKRTQMNRYNNALLINSCENFGLMNSELTAWRTHNRGGSDSGGSPAEAELRRHFCTRWKFSSPYEV